MNSNPFLRPAGTMVFGADPQTGAPSAVVIPEGTALTIDPSNVTHAHPETLGLRKTLDSIPLSRPILLAGGLAALWFGYKHFSKG